MVNYEYCKGIVMLKISKVDGIFLKNKEVVVS